MYLSETRPSEVNTVKATDAKQDDTARMMAAFEAFMAADFIDEIAANVAQEGVYPVATANENDDDFALETVAA
jgi:hypothetical protein